MLAQCCRFYAKEKLIANQHKASVLLIDDNASFLHSTRLMLERAGTGPVDIIDDSRKVLARLATSPPIVILLDLGMPYLSGFDLLSEIRKAYPDIAIIVITATKEPETIVECMNFGAIDYLTKPIKQEQLISRIKKLLEMCSLRNQPTTLSSDTVSARRVKRADVFADIVTCNPKMIHIFQYLESISHSSEPILITGETGVGKELIARAVHRLHGNHLPFIIENVAGLDDSMFSDTLLGHVKGAFTDAHTDRQGLLSIAGEGVLVLDEIGDLNNASQIKLLRIIQERSYTQLGTDAPSTFQARIVATTHQNLDKLVAAGTFRQDLIYRLSTHKVQIPPLRKRRKDIPLLLEYFIRDAARSMNKKIPLPPDDLYDTLAHHDFPGNIRELRAMAMDAAAKYKKSGPLPLESFSCTIRQRDQIDQHPAADDASPFHSSPLRTMIPANQPLPTLKNWLQEMERYLIEEAIARTKGNYSRAATLLGLTRQALHHRIQYRKKTNS